jgi:hypothetical protein
LSWTEVVTASPFSRDRIRVFKPQDEVRQICGKSPAPAPKLAHEMVGANFRPMGRTGLPLLARGALVAIFVAAPASAHAQNISTLPHVPELRLTWPIAPSSFSFTYTEVPGYAEAPLRLFRAESLWLQTPALKLLTIGSAERAPELDCRSTCQPIVQTSIHLEARMPLPALGPYIPATYAFVRQSSFYTSQNPRFTRQLSTGLGGLLNF